MPNRLATFVPARSLVALLALLAALAVTAPAEAKPKRIVSNGCTAEQIQSPKAAQCINKLEQDIMSGSATYHALYCSSSGALLCCQYDQSGNVLDHSCEVQRMSRPPLDAVVAPGTLAPPSLSDQSSGGDNGPAAPADEVMTIF